MHEHEAKLLEFIAKRSGASMEEIEKGTNIGRDSVLWALESLSKKGAVSVKKRSAKEIRVSEEGKRYLKEFPEESLVKALLSKKRDGISNIKDQIGLSWAKRNGWISVIGSTVSLTQEGAKAARGEKEYATRAAMARLASSSGKEAADVLDRYGEIAKTLSRRGLIDVKDRPVIENVSITKAGESLLSKEPKEQGIGMLTKELIKSEEWKRKRFKQYDVNAPADISYPARIHPVREFMNKIRSTWFEMGFVEVEGPIIESAFWNFDALFSPQDHPTRDMQDTFFLSNPKQLSIEDIELMKRVKEMHLAGWKEEWRQELARGAILRTHTTSVSARQMKKLASAMGSNYPTKMFSIGPVFRNESIDYKHLAEIRMYDGIIAGDNLTLANLIYTLRSFYGKLGLSGISVRPSYFPFTEPSLEFFYFDKEHNDYVELCGGGIIRKEITKAMGLNKTVLAWGGGADRLLLNKSVFGVDTLPQLYKNDIAWLRSRGNVKV